MKNSELRKIPSKNYLILAIVIIITMLILYYFYLWIDAYNETKLNRPILNKYMEVINYNELNNYLIENPNTIIYASVLENKQIRNFEKQFKTAYKKHEIARDILYLNITDDIRNKNTRDEMQAKYHMNGINMTQVPLIIVFEDGSIKSIYSIKDNGYDIDRLKSFLDSIIFVSEDDLNG